MGTFGVLVTTVSPKRRSVFLMAAYGTSVCEIPHNDYIPNIKHRQGQEFPAPLSNTLPVMDLQELREQIDTVDTELVTLLNRRAELSLEVGRRKAGSANQRYFAPERERDLIQRLFALHTGPLPKEALLAVYREIISASIALQKPMTVAYWGPPGTFTEMASLKRFGSSAAYHDCPSIAEVFGEVERGRADYGVVPVENSTDGVVPYTLDMFHETSLKVCAEIYVTIVQNLLTHAKDLGQIQRLYSAPIVIAQCRHWLDTHLPNVEILETQPTSKAAERAAADPNGAAIAPLRASEVYQVPILFDSIQDSPHNRTRFLVIGRNEPPPTGRDKTSLLFAVKNEPGGLSRALRVFEAHQINMSMITSRPTRNMAWEYVQFVDFAGHEQHPEILAALEELRAHTTFVNVLGSYPEGE
jgi:chorismate mutase/prephenate dehydratase